MPQLDSSNFLSQILWLIITFAALYWYLSRFILPKLGGIISQRASVLTSDLEQATLLQNKISSIQQEIIKESNATNEKIKVIHLELAKKIHHIKQEGLDRINEGFLKKQGQVRDEIIKTKKLAYDDMQGYVIDYVAQVITKITGAKPNIKALEQYYTLLEAKS